MPGREDDRGGTTSRESCSQTLNHVRIGARREVLSNCPGLGGEVVDQGPAVERRDVASVRPTGCHRMVRQDYDPAISVFLQVRFESLVEVVSGAAAIRRRPQKPFGVEEDQMQPFPEVQRRRTWTPIGGE